MITFVYDRSGDWVAVYRDGDLIDQGHSVEPQRLLSKLGIEYEVISDGNAEATGYEFPGRLDEVFTGEEDLTVLGNCMHGVNLDRDFCPDGCRV